MNLISRRFIDKIKEKGAKNAHVMNGDFMHVNEKIAVKVNPPKKMVTLNDVTFFNEEFGGDYECRFVISNCGVVNTALKYMIENNIDYVHFTKDGRFVPIDLKNKSFLYTRTEDDKYKRIIF